MRLKFVIITVLIITFQSCIEDKIILSPKNTLKEFSKVKEQIFDIGSSEFEEIKGKKGTILYFNKNDFEIEKDADVRIILKEYFTLEELIYNNIRTITGNGELLESSGVIYLRIESNGKKINLKKNKFIIAKFPKEQIENMEIFYAETDSLNQFLWKKDSIKYTTIIRSENRGGGVTIDTEYIVPSDSIDFYNQKIDKEIEEYQNKIKEYNQTIGSISTAFNDNYEFINIDKLVVEDLVEIDIEFELSIQEIEFLTIYFFYENKNSFISHYLIDNDLSFEKMPIIKNQTSVFIVGQKNRNFYMDNFEIDEKSSKYKINLKRVKKEKIVNFIKNSL